MTRFVIIKREFICSEDEINRASLKFELDHKREFATILNVMSD
jgi:prephenate dehydratase